MRNPLKEKLAAGGIAKLMSLRQLRTADAVLMVREAGFDGFYVDCEHGAYTVRETSDLCMAAQAYGLTPLVRVHSTSVGTIGPALDGGAAGIIVPHIGNAQDARDAVALAKYPPHGHRSMAALSAASGYKRMQAGDAAKSRDAGVMVIAMVETAEGVKNAESIAAVSGIDALMMGPMDLSLELGIPGEVRHKSICDAYLDVLSASLKHGKQFVAGAAGGPEISQLVAAGARIVMGGNDTGYLLQALEQAAAAMDKTIATP